MPPRKRQYNSPPAMGGDSTKRVRFNSEEVDDDTGEFDFPNRKARRGAVKDTDGYQDDSSGDDDGGPRSRVAPANADDEDDMFGSTSAGGSRAGMEAGEPDLDAKDNDTRVRDSGLDLSKEAAKGGKEFLELGDIQGQEFGSTEAAGSINREKRLSENQTRLVYEDQEDYVEGEEHANDDDAYVPKERKSAQGMGFAMSRFNMKDEMEEGKFSADGNYTANAKDPDAVHDNWLTSLTTQDLQAAQRAKEKQDALIADRHRVQDAKILSRIDCLKAMLQKMGGLVQPGESVQTALVRLGKARKHEQEAEKERLKQERKNSKKSRPKKDFDAPSPPGEHQTESAGATGSSIADMDAIDPLAPPHPVASGALKEAPANGTKRSTDTPIKIAIDTLTTLASTMLGTYGETAIYDETYGGMIKQLVAEGEVPRNWKPTVEPLAGSANGNDITHVSSDKSESDALTITETKKPSSRKTVISRPLISRPSS